jgi:hypothetical protein
MSSVSTTAREEASSGPSVALLCWPKWGRLGQTSLFRLRQRNSTDPVHSHDRLWR